VFCRKRAKVLLWNAPVSASTPSGPSAAASPACGAIRTRVSCSSLPQSLRPLRRRRDHVETGLPLKRLTSKSSGCAVSSDRPDASKGGGKALRVPRGNFEKSQPRLLDHSPSLGIYGKTVAQSALATIPRPVSLLLPRPDTPLPRSARLHSRARPGSCLVERPTGDPHATSVRGTDPCLDSPAFFCQLRQIAAFFIIVQLRFRKLNDVTCL
jgi:hypothetical protein